MKKKNQVSIMAAVALAVGATATSKLPIFSGDSAIAAVAFDHGNDSKYANTRLDKIKVYAQTQKGSLGPAQPNDDSYQVERTGKCGAQQASGGQKGDRRTIKFPASKGKKTVRLAYQMLRIPDRLEIIYKGKIIYNTGFVSGFKTRTLSFNETPKEITVVLTGNPANYRTLWAYRVDCPK